jgi:hypothetical protein
MTARARSRCVLLAAALGAGFALAGCVVDDPVAPGPGETPVPCTASPLCRLQTPADTISLSAAQKARVLTWFESLDDSVVVALADVALDSLAADTVRFKLLSDLQVTIDSSFEATTDAIPPDTVTITDWRGYVAAPHTGFVDLTFHNHEFESGFAHLNGKYITLYPLGGSKALVADDSRVESMGECPAGAKRSATALTCPPVTP